MLKEEIKRLLIETEDFIAKATKEGNPTLVTYFTGMKVAYERTLKSIEEVENN